MRPAHRVVFHINDGHEFHVLRTAIISISEMDRYEQSDINPATQQPYKNGETDLISGAPWLSDAEPSLATIVAVEGMGSVTVDETLDQAVALWDGYRHEESLASIAYGR